jgi:hypothetical protein
MQRRVQIFAGLAAVGRRDTKMSSNESAMDIRRPPQCGGARDVHDTAPRRVARRRPGYVRCLQGDLLIFFSKFDTSTCKARRLQTQEHRVLCTSCGSPDPLGPIQDGFRSSCDSLDPTSISTSTVLVGKRRRQCIRFQAQPGRIRPIRACESSADSSARASARALRPHSHTFRVFSGPCVVTRKSISH